MVHGSCGHHLQPPNRWSQLINGICQHARWGAFLLFSKSCLSEAVTEQRTDRWASLGRGCFFPGCLAMTGLEVRVGGTVEQSDSRVYNPSMISHSVRWISIYDWKNQLSPAFLSHAWTITAHCQLQSDELACVCSCAHTSTRSLNPVIKWATFIRAKSCSLTLFSSLIHKLW